MTRLFSSLALVVAIEAIASAQPAPADLTIWSFDPEQAVAPISTVEGAGIKIGQGTVLRPVFGLETGVVSNVFYQPQSCNPAGLSNTGCPVAAGVLRLLAQIGTSSLSAQRLTPNTDDNSATAREGDFEYRANARVSYDQMLSNDSTVNSTGGLGLGATFMGAYNPQGKLTFGFDEEYMRLIRAANFETDSDTNRDINTLGINLLLHPQSSAFSGFAYYQNTIDVFERSQQQFADRIQHKFGLHPMYRWLPQTTFYIDASVGLYSGLGSSSTKVSSTPVDILGGVATLLTPKITFNLDVGYAAGNYSTGPSYSGVVVDAALGYRYSPLGRVALTYDLLYNDSVNANYYRDHVIRVWVQHLFSPFVVMAQPEIHFREYQGIMLPGITGAPVRDDTIISVIAGVHYNFRSWLAMTLDYHYSQIITNYTYMETGIPQAFDPSFMRHELLLGVRVAM